MLAVFSEIKRTIRTPPYDCESENFGDLDVEFGGEIKETVWDSFHAVFEEYLF
jgi:hypothetical protein